MGLLFGGRLENLVNLRIQWVSLIFGALALRYGTQLAISNGIALADQLRLPLYATAYALLVGGLWLNRRHAGLLVVAAGSIANAFAIVVNGGWMPVWMPALDAAGLTTANLSASFHRPLPVPFGPEFLAQAGPFADVIPFPVPFLRNVASIGDVFISAGLGWFLFTTLMRPRGEADEGGISLGRGAPPRTVGFDRPVLLGGARGAGVTSTAGGMGSSNSDKAAVLGRLSGHPYVRLALDARFTAFWLGQTISLLGDRLHQVALGVLVFQATGSPLLTGLVFLAATLPNLLLGPIAGTFVDRWDHKRVMVVSDLIRAALVLAIPFVVQRDIVLVYPLVFLITAVSLFFRPAKASVVPRIVAPRDLMAANSATWTSETLADIAGFPLAFLFVASLGGALSIAFFVDAASYLISALLIAGIVIPPVARSAAPRLGGAVRAFLGELRDGWRMLSDKPPLFHNTLISAVAQTSIGATLALMVVYASEALDGTLIPYPQNYAAIETAIGIGNLIGGLTVGAIGTHLRKGPLIVGGFIVMGIATVALGLTGNVLLALVAATVIGIANLVYVIPSQTLFAELTPPEFMGRVVALRSTIVYGALTGAMAVSGVLAEAFPVGLVIAGFGLVTALSGLVAAFLPGVRNS